MDLFNYLMVFEDGVILTMSYC